jgi:16S rRNA processing protein RimM
MDDNRPPAEPDASPGWVMLARVLRPQGRRGEVLAELLTDFPERFEENRRVFLAPAGYSGREDCAREAEVSSHWLPMGKNQGRIVIHFQGIDSISDAEKLAGLDVLIPEAERLELNDEDASYISDLVGCMLFDLADNAAAVGVVTDVQFAMTSDGGRRLEDAAPILAVETGNGDEVLIPYVKAFLVSLDVPARRIEMRLPSGLIDLNR